MLDGKGVRKNMSILKKLFIIIAILPLWFSASNAATYETKSGHFKLGFYDDVNLDASGNLIVDRDQFSIGLLVYDFVVVKEDDQSVVFKKRYFKPASSNVTVMEATLTAEGNYLAAVKAVNIMLRNGSPIEVSAPPAVVHNIIFKRPEPTPTPSPTPPPTPVPTPTPLPDWEPAPIPEGSFFFEDLEETDFGNETNFGGGGNIGTSGLLELLK